MSADRSSSQNVLGSLAGYAMSDSDEEAEDMHKLSGSISGSDDEASTHSQVPSRTYSPVIKDDEPPEKRKATVSSLGLVSYGAHDEEDDESDREQKISDSDEEDVKSASSADASQANEDRGVVDYDKTYTAEDLANAAVNGSTDAEDFDVQIPPSPPGSPPKSLIEKITTISKRGKGSLDTAIQSSKDFRNPSIYEKLLSHLGVDEKGTNYPPELYDPSIWGKSSYYDELAKLQNIEMEKKKAEKKDRVKVDFISATKSTVATDSADGSGNKKSKWDTSSQQTSQAQTGNAAPPVGSLIKKK